ncbi:MAG: ATP-binding cassette domain-containing protein [Candidatus Bathyarchaeia archaeon]
MKAAVSVQNLAKHYGDIVAVDHISFEVKRREIFGFLGPNGAGKTTTIRILTGIIKPDEGQVTIMDHDITKEALQAKQIMGIVPEMANAYIDLSAWNNLMLIGELYGVPKKQRIERAKRLLEKFGLYDRRDQLVRGFSKGMKQRLILCMALINEPQILFLDEPTSGLDVESAKQIREEIIDLNHAGITVFMTTHNMEEANKLCDRIAVINHGKIAAIDTPENLRMKSSELQSIEVSFHQPVNIDDLAEMPYIEQVKKMGDKIKLYTNEPNEALNCVVDYARIHKLKIVTLNIVAPSLEEVFLKLIQPKKEE